jgi:hypothetical protein
MTDLLGYNPNSPRIPDEVLNFIDSVRELGKSVIYICEHPDINEVYRPEHGDHLVVPENRATVSRELTPILEVKAYRAVAQE